MLYDGNRPKICSGDNKQMAKTNREKSNKNLNLLKNTDNSEVQAERGRKGGLAKSPAKVVAYFGRKKCKNCNLPCPLKDKGIAEDWNCKVPNAKRLILEAGESQEKLMGSIIGDVMEMQSLAKTLKDKDLVVKRKLDLKKELFPNVQQHKVESLNVNLMLEDMAEFFERCDKKEEENE